MLSIIFFVSALLASGQALSSRQEDEIDRQTLEVMRCARLSAVSLSIVALDQQTVYNRAYGSFSKSSGRQATTQDAFCIGGGTQAFTAVLLAKLIDMNENVTWDTPVQEIVGYRVVLKDSYVGDHLTLKDIFARRSGLSPMDIVPWVKPYSADELVRKLRYAPTSTGFREKYVPSDILFSLVTDVVEELGQDTWYNLIRRHILQPLQMTQTTFIGTNNVASGVDVINGNVYYNGQPQVVPNTAYNGLELIAPAASICTSADDFSRWLRLLVYGGRSLSNTLVIREETLRMLYEPLTPRGRGNPDVEGFAEPDHEVGYYRDQNTLGFIAGRYRDYQFVSQDGSLPGYQSLATIIPSKDLAVYVSFNSDQRPKSFAAKVLLNQIGLETVLKGQTWFKSRQICDVIDKMERLFQTPVNENTRNVVRTGRPGPRSLEEYEGTYKNFAFGDLDVKVENKSDSGVALMLSYGSGMYALEPTNVNDTFQLRADSGDLWYSTNADYYRETNKMIATFSFDPRDEDERIHKVTISGFSDDDVEFAVNPREPEYDIGRAQDATCGAQGLSATMSASIVLALLILTVTRFLER